jgi:hypothetical protein
MKKELIFFKLLPRKRLAVHRFRGSAKRKKEYPTKM